MQSPPRLFKRVQERRPGQSYLQSFAHEVVAIQRFLERIADRRYRSNLPSLEFQWDTYNKAIQTLTWLRLRKGLSIPNTPILSSHAPPSVALATLGDWLMTLANDESPRVTALISPTDQDNKEDLISCSTAATIWDRSYSWWRKIIGKEDLISYYMPAGKKMLFKHSDAERLAHERGIPKRKRAS